MAEDAALVPSAEKAIFLLTTPPKSLFHDSHKSVQIQRVVHRSETTLDLRIKPIFNLEYHKLFATRVIELEDDDAKIAEFHPSKAHHDEPEPQPMDGRTRRRRARSIDHRGGEYGGKISSSSAVHGFCDVTVVGSEREGIFLFQCADGQALHWQRRRVGPVPEWVLLKSGQSSIDSTRPPKARTSYEFGKAPRQTHDPPESPLEPPPTTIGRTATSSSLASQYTTHFNNESQLSGLTNSPQVDERDIPISKDAGRARSGTEEEDEDEEEEVPYTTLCPLPVPHLTVVLSEGGQGPRQRHSMHDITRTNHEIYRVLLCALWITWSSSDILSSAAAPAEGEATHRHLQMDVGEGTGVGHDRSSLPIADRGSKVGQSRGSDDRSVVKTRDLRSNSDPEVVRNKAKKRGGFRRVLGRLCGGGGKAA